ncbi:MAG: metallophosphoesterase family protein [bacterium]
MKTIIFSDIHGNLEALECFKAVVSEIEHDRIFCLGDIVGYGANPNECVEYVRQNNITSVSGNHDDVVSSRVEPDDFNPDARRAILWCREKTTKNNRKFLRSLEDRLIIESPERKFMLVHGSPYDKDEYILSSHSAVRSFAVMQREAIDFAFVAHTHQPCVWVWKSGSVAGMLQPTDENRQFRFEPGLSAIINAGSVGQPRDSDPRGCFVIWDEVEAAIEFVRFIYDVRAAQQKIMEADLPIFLADRLAAGY